MATGPIPSPMDWVDETVYAAADYNREIRDAVNFLLRPPFFFGQHTSSVNVPNATWTALPLQTEIYNSEGTSMHSTSTNTTRVIATHAGTWDFYGGGSWSFPSGSGNIGRKISGMRKNGSIFLRGRTDNIGVGAATDSMVQNSHHVVVDMAVGDYVELMAYQETGFTATSWTLSADTYPYLMAGWRAL